jgi:hypothetical protein
MRGYKTMDKKLQGFFDTAQKKADETTAAQNAAVDAAAERARILAENRKQLRSQIDEEITPILDILAGLPEKDGKRFSTSIQQQGFEDDIEARYGVSVSYRDPREDRYDHHYDYDRARPEFAMNITRQPNGSLEIRVTQYSMLNYNSDGDPSHKYVSTKDFEAARQELAVGLGTFAADRMAEIGAALGASQDTDAATPAAQTDENKIDVFRKPLAFKNAARTPEPAVTKPEPDMPPAPAVQQTGAAPATRKKKWFWQR